MRNLQVYNTNPFDDPNISLAELLAFTTDHVQRMSAANPTLFAARITATTTALTGVNAAFTDDETKLALRKSRKQLKNAFRDALPARVGKIAVAVANQFGEGAAEFTECFPHGRKQFSDCPDDELASVLQTLINGVTHLTPPLAATLGTDAAALLTGWQAVYAPSESATGAKTTTQLAKQTAREALQLELFKNLLTIALNFPRQTDQVAAYMQQSLLLNPLRPPTAAPQPSPAPPAP